MKELWKTNQWSRIL